MSDKSYDGDPIDMAWSTPPWQNDGETLEAYDSDGDGEIMTDNWPENATDPDELNERQRKMILTAARYPNTDSPTQLVELSGLDVAPSYPQNVLEPHWSERFWGANNSEKNVEAKSTSELVDEVRLRLLDGEYLNTVKEDYQIGEERLSNLVKGEHDEVLNCDTEPIVYANDSRQCWLARSEYEKTEKETLSDHIETIRNELLNGRKGEDIAEDYNVTGRSIRRIAKDESVQGCEDGIGALEYDTHAKEWEIKGDKEDTTQHTSEPENITVESDANNNAIIISALAFGAFVLWAIKRMLR